MVLFEHPLLIVFFGALGVGAASIIAAKTGHRYAIWGVAASVAMLLVGLGIERLVVTPREEIKATLFEIEHQLEANDLEGVLRYMDPDAHELRREVKDAMRTATIKTISIKHNLRVVVGLRRPVQMAEARFNAVATVEGPAQFGGSFAVPRFLVLRFRRHSEGWRVIEYESFDPRGGRVRQGPAF